MSYMFKDYPLFAYDVKRNGQQTYITDLSYRFKVDRLLKDRTVVMYDYQVQDGERADHIAHKYYDDASLDWLIYMTNDVIDPQFDWPLSMVNLELFIKEKYGSASAAKATVHHYEHILQAQSIVQADDRAFSVGVKERTIRVDKETFDALPTDSRREVDSYTFEVQQNEEKSRIKIIDEKFVSGIITSYRNAVIQLGH